MSATVYETFVILCNPHVSISPHASYSSFSSSSFLLIPFIIPFFLLLLFASCMLYHFSLPCVLCSSSPFLSPLCSSSRPSIWSQALLCTNNGLSILVCVPVQAIVSSWVIHVSQRWLLPRLPSLYSLLSLPYFYHLFISFFPFMMIPNIFVLWFHAFIC